MPMLAPANGTGKGTRDDPWAPIGWRETRDRTTWQIRKLPNRSLCLAEVSGDAAALDQLAAMPGVEEIADTDEKIDAGKLARVEGRGLPLARKASGREVIASLKQAIFDKQVAERPRRVPDAVRDAIRAGS